MGVQVETWLWEVFEGFRVLVVDRSLISVGFLRRGLKKKVVFGRAEAVWVGKSLRA